MTLPPEFTLSITNTSRGTMNETPFLWRMGCVQYIRRKIIKMKCHSIRPEKNRILKLRLLLKVETMLLLTPKAKTIPELLQGLSLYWLSFTKEIQTLYTEVGAKDMGMGLKDIAQKGDATKLKDALTKPESAFMSWVVPL